MSRSFRASVLVLLLLILLFPVTSGQGSHGLSDHHAFLAGRSQVPAQGHHVIRVDHLYFEWATLWYSARVETGPSIRAFMLNERNLELFNASNSYRAVTGTLDGPGLMLGGLATLQRGVYALVLHNPGLLEATVKWEVFLEPRLQGEPGNLPVATSDASGLILLATVATAVAVSLLVTWWLLRRRGV